MLFDFSIFALSETWFACEYLTMMCNLSEVPIDLFILKYGCLGKIQRNLGKSSKQIENHPSSSEFLVDSKDFN